MVLITITGPNYRFIRIKEEKDDIGSLREPSCNPLPREVVGGGVRTVWWG